MWTVQFTICSGIEGPWRCRQRARSQALRGADTLSSKKENTIGSMNVKVALEIIREEHLRIIAADVGDSFGGRSFSDPYRRCISQEAEGYQGDRAGPGITFKTRGK